MDIHMCTALPLYSPKPSFPVPRLSVEAGSGTLPNDARTMGETFILPFSSQSSSEQLGNSHEGVRVDIPMVHAMCECVNE